MLQNNVNQVETYKATQSTIKTKHLENAPLYQLLATTRGNIAYDHPPAPTKKISVCRSMSFNITQGLDDQKVSASNNHDYLCNNLPDVSYNMLPKHFKTFKMPLGKNIQSKLRLFESIEQKNEDVVTKQEKLQPQITELNCTSGETHQSELNGDVMKELYKIRCQKNYTPLTQMPKLSDIEKINLESSNGSILPKDLLPSLSDFYETCNIFDSVPEPYGQDVMGASS